MAFTNVSLFTFSSLLPHKSCASNTRYHRFIAPHQRVAVFHGAKQYESLQNSHVITTKSELDSFSNVLNTKKPPSFQSEWDDVVFVLSSEEARNIGELLKYKSKEWENRKSDVDTSFLGDCCKERNAEKTRNEEQMEKLIEVDDVSVELGSKQTTIRMNIDNQTVDILGVDLTKATLEYLTSRENAAWLIFPDGSYSRAARHGNFASVSLRPISESFPTMIIGGFGMHRFARDVRPCTDTANKIRALKPRGRVLDICTGLGYTAITAANMPNVSSVLTIEKDEAVLEMTRINPWSRALHTIPNIEIKIGDAIDIISRIPNTQKFDSICHDPPALAYAGELYSGAFYAQLNRLISNNGRLFHYIGNPNSDESGRLFKGVKKRLLEAGFTHVQTVENAFGVVAMLQVPTSRTMEKLNHRRTQTRNKK